MGAYRTVLQTCRKNGCPSVHDNGTGDLIVQGYECTGGLDGVSPLLDGQAAVEVPTGLLLQAEQELNGRTWPHSEPAQVTLLLPQFTVSSRPGGPTLQAARDWPVPSGLPAALVVRGAVVTGDTRDALRLPEGEQAVHISEDRLLHAVRQLRTVGSLPISPLATEDVVLDAAGFGALFDRPFQEVFRLEVFQEYRVVDEEEDLRCWREGQRLPARTPENDTWLARLQRTTAAGVHWGRAHVVDEPLSDYLRFEIEGYHENAAAGEDIVLVPRTAHPDLARLREDFWLFDPGRSSARTVLMDYDRAGRLIGHLLVRQPDIIRSCEQQRQLVLQHAVPLSEYRAAA